MIYDSEVLFSNSLLLIGKCKITFSSVIVIFLFGSKFLLLSNGLRPLFLGIFISFSFFGLGLRPLFFFSIIGCSSTFSSGFFGLRPLFFFSFTSKLLILKIYNFIKKLSLNKLKISFKKNIFKKSKKITDSIV